MIYGATLYLQRLAPGYLIIFDYDALNVLHLKFWNHIDSYAAGILMSMVYQRMKQIRVHENPQSWFDKVINYFGSIARNEFSISNKTTYDKAMNPKANSGMLLIYSMLL